MNIHISNIKSNTLIYRALAFLLPIFLLLLCFWKKQIYPFGDYTIYTWDMQEQYSSLFVLLHNILVGSADFSYSLVGGLGDSLYGLIAYYLASPFNIILIFFDAHTMPLGIVILTCLKTSCMSGFMYLYLNHKHASFSAIFFSTAYALSSYAIAYQSNIMWMDALVFLPLVIWGLEKLVDNGSIRLYAISLGITVISNYYIGYMVCLFCVIYFLLYFIFHTNRPTFSMCKSAISRFIAGSLLGGGISMFLLLPTIKELSNFAGKSHSQLDSLLNGSRLYIQTRLLPLFMACAYDDSHRWDINGFPLVYCGLIAIIGLIAFFLSGKISLQKKLFGLILLLCMFISYNHMNLFIVWHGFYAPFGAPWRFAFIGVFSMLILSYEGFLSLYTDTQNRSLLLCTIGGFLCYIIYLYLRCPEYRSIICFNFIIASIIFLSVIVTCYLHLRKNASSIICLCAICVELCINTLFIWSQGFEFESYSRYQQYLSQIECLQPSGNEHSFFRSLTLNNAKRTANDGYLFSNNIPNQYTSTSKVMAHNIYHCLGITYDELPLDYMQSSTALSNALLNLRYIYGNEINIANYNLVNQSDYDVSLYENTYVLPLVFEVNDTASDIIASPQDNNNLFNYQNALFHALTEHSGTPYTLIEPLETDTTYPTSCISHVEKSIYTDGTSFYQENTELINETIKKVSTATISVDTTHHSNISAQISNNGTAAYACFSIPYDKNWKATVNGKTVDIVPGMGGFLLVPIEEGFCEINISYFSKELFLGCLISILSLFCTFKFKPAYHSSTYTIPVPEVTEA